MNERDILLSRTLIEIYDRELARQGRLHFLVFLGCSKCKSLINKRTTLIIKLQKEEQSK